MLYKTLLITAIVVVAVIVNFFFGLYNLKISKKVRTFTKTQSGLILLINTLNTGNCLIHLLVNMIIGAYKKD